MQGTIEYAAEKLEKYRNKLENRVIMRFDAAVAAPSNLEGMAHCARIMAEFKRGEAALVQVRHPSFCPCLYVFSCCRPGCFCVPHAVVSGLWVGLQQRCVQTFTIWSGFGKCSATYRRGPCSWSLRRGPPTRPWPMGTPLPR